MRLKRVSGLILSPANSYKMYRHLMISEVFLNYTMNKALLNGKIVVLNSLYLYKVF